MAGRHKSIAAAHKSSASDARPLRELPSPLRAITRARNAPAIDVNSIVLVRSSLRRQCGRAALVFEPSLQHPDAPQRVAVRALAAAMGGKQPVQFRPIDVVADLRAAVQHLAPELLR